MKRFHELSKEEQQQAAEHCLGSILEGILASKFRLNDEKNQNNIQAVIDAAVARAAEIPEDERSTGIREVAIGLVMQATFTEADGTERKMSDELLELARADAEESWFVDSRDKLVRLEVRLEEPVSA